MQFAEHGVEESILLLQSCLDYLNVHTDYLNVPMEVLGIHFRAVLVAILNHLLDKPNFSTVFCLSVNNGTISEYYLEKLSDALSLSLSEKVGIGLALSVSENLDTRNCGKFNCLLRLC